jgi:hypothetical protein
MLNFGKGGAVSGEFEDPGYHRVTVRRSIELG